MSLIKFLDTLGKMACTPGASAVSVVDKAVHGGITNSKTIHLNGDCFHARDILKDDGIEAFGVMWGDKAETVQVHRGDYKRAMRLLQKNGWDVW